MTQKEILQKIKQNLKLDIGWLGYIGCLSGVSTQRLFALYKNDKKLSKRDENLLLKTLENPYNK